MKPLYPLTTCRLGDVLRRHNEIIHPGDRTEGTTPFVGLEHVESQTGRRIGCLSLDLGKLTGRKPTFRAGQIVYGYLRPYLNKVWVAEFDGCSSVDQFAFDVRRELAHVDYIAAFMRSETFLRRSSVVSTTGQLPRISIDEVLNVKVELPPLAEQKRIAVELTVGMVEVDRAHRAAEERLAAAEALPAAYLREVFEGPDAEGWEIVDLGDALLRIETGTSVTAESRRAKSDEIGVLRVSAVSWGRFKPEENKAVPPSYTPTPAERVKPGDFLISRCNTAELTGAVVLVRDTPPNLMLSDKTLRLVLKPNTYDPRFLEVALRTRAARRFIEGRATGTSYSMRNISQDTIRLIPLPKPPMAVQEELVSQFHRQSESANALIARCREELAAVEALPAALLRRAFGSDE